MLSSAYRPTQRHMMCILIIFFIQNFCFSPVLTQMINAPMYAEEECPSKIFS